MIQAIARLVFISILVILGLFVAGFAARLTGLSSPYGESSNPIAQLKNVRVALGGDTRSAPPDTLEALQAALNLDSSIVLGIDVNISLDGVWFAFPYQNLESKTRPSEVVELTNWSELSKANLVNTSGQTFRIPTLEEILKIFSTQPLLINVLCKYPAQMNSLVQVLDPDNRSQRFLIQSPYATALREIRKRRPLWLFGMDPSSVIRFLFMNSLYLEPVTDLNADVFVAPLRIDHTMIFQPRVVAEVLRRKKRLLLETDNPEIPEDLKPHLFGIMTREIHRFVEAH